MDVRASPGAVRWASRKHRIEFVIPGDKKTGNGGRRSRFRETQPAL